MYVENDEITEIKQITLGLSSICVLQINEPLPSQKCNDKRAML